MSLWAIEQNFGLWSFKLLKLLYFVFREGGVKIVFPLNRRQVRWIKITKVLTTQENLLQYVMWQLLRQCNHHTMGRQSFLKRNMFELNFGSQQDPWVVLEEPLAVSVIRAHVSFRVHLPRHGLGVSPVARGVDGVQEGVGYFQRQSGRRLQVITPHHS